MKITCEKQKLQNAIQIVENAVSTKNTLPVLANILIEVQKDKVILVGTDLELTIKHFFTPKIEKEGSITVSAKKISSIIKELPDKEIIVEAENNVLIIKCEKLVYKIKGLPQEEFPTLPTIKQDKNISLKLDMLIDMINKTIYAVSIDEIRYMLNGLFVNIQKDLIKVVATDGHRLSYIYNEIKTNIEEEIKVIIPKKTLQELSKIANNLENKDIDIDIKISENQIIFTLDSTVLISRLIEGQYPDYNKVIPENLIYKAKLKREDVMRSTRRISLMSNSKKAGIRYNFNKSILEIIAINPEEGEAREEILCEEYSGDELIIGYNYHYLMDIFKIIDTEEIYFEFSKPSTPGIIKPAGKNNYINVIMPMKIEQL